MRVTDGAFGAALGCLAKVGERADLFQIVWNIESATALTAGQKYAFHRWVNPAKDRESSEWIPGEHFHREAKAVLDLAPAPETAETETA